MSNSLIAISTILVLFFIVVFPQFTNPCLYEVDGYYHIRIPYLIRESGMHYNFPWAQFTTFKKFFSDKEFLFHILILPFTFIGNGIHIQARFAVIFFALVLFLAYIFIQRRYILKSVLILSILSLPLSTLFLIYVNYLRPKTAAITILLLLLYSLIERRLIWVFILSIIYSLTHISFPLSIILAVGIEFLRYLYNKEFYIKNIFFLILGLYLGVFIHPNFPNNIISIHLNAVLVPWNTMFGNLHLDYGMEWNPANTQIVLLDLLVFFIGLFFAIILLITKNPRLGFHTASWFFITSFFFFLSMFSNAYWYFTYPMGLIFLGMFFSDYLRNKSNATKNIFLCAMGIVLALKAFIMYRQDSIQIEIASHIERNSHYERMAYWMNRYIPAGEVVYHTSWSDSPYFICLNPKDYYLTMLDPIYMYYYSPEIYNLYNNLSHGYIQKPARILKKIFKIRYTYTGKGYGLYSQLKDRKNFKLLFEDEYGAVFQLVKNKKTP